MYFHTYLDKYLHTNMHLQWRAEFKSLKIICWRSFWRFVFGGKTKWMIVTRDPKPVLKVLAPKVLARKKKKEEKNTWSKFLNTKAKLFFWAPVSLFSHYYIYFFLPPHNANFWLKLEEWKRKRNVGLEIHGTRQFTNCIFCAFRKWCDLIAVVARARIMHVIYHL